MQRWKPCQARLHPGEKLFAYLDDVWLVSQLERVGQVHNVAEHELDPRQDPSAQREDSCLEPVREETSQL